MSISALAFAISASTFLISTILQSDDLRIIVTSVPSVSPSEKGDTIELGQNAKIAVINAGNRAAAIIDISVSILQPSKKFK